MAKWTRGVKCRKCGWTEKDMWRRSRMWDDLCPSCGTWCQAWFSGLREAAHMPELVAIRRRWPWQKWETKPLDIPGR